MGELKSFIIGLKGMGFEKVVIDIGSSNHFVALKDLQSEVKKLKLIEVVDTYWEDFIFIADNNEIVEIHAVY